ncbi:MAG: carbohydrate ABC transporter permease [Clostridia bacterium]|nr:carbohydrate ABC transporter permease [Clostridia bacterium]
MNRKLRIGRTAASMIKNIIIALIVAYSVGLFVYILLSAFKPLKEVMARAKLFPRNATLDNFISLFKATSSNKNFPRYLLNSMFVSICTALLTCTIGSLAAYGFSRHNYIGKKVMLNSMLFLYVFPTIILLVPLYKMFSLARITDNYLALIITYAGLTLPFCTWILVSFFDRVPPSLEEAAFVDGATPFQTFIRVLLPVATPGLVMVLAYSFITAWGEYTFASILIQSNINRTITQSLVDFTADQYIDWGLLLAGSVIVLVPVVAIFIPVSKNFIKGFTAGAVKE